MPDTIDDVDEHPIIFNDWSIRRILAGEKTQTRRIVKPQPPKEYRPIGTPPRYYDGDGHKYLKYGSGWYYERQTAVDETKLYQVGGASGCPYGQPGDVLWVREAFRLDIVADDLSPTQVLECHEENDMFFDLPFTRYEADERVWFGCSSVQEPAFGRLRPSIHMPRELCRLRLRVEDVRVERVQEIDAVDAIAEGIADPFDHTVMPDGIGGVELDDKRRTIHELAFKALWQSIHGDGAWERNDWVWVVEFSRIDGK